MNVFIDNNNISFQLFWLLVVRERYNRYLWRAVTLSTGMLAVGYWPFMKLPVMHAFNHNCHIRGDLSIKNLQYQIIILVLVRILVCDHVCKLNTVIYLLQRVDCSFNFAMNNCTVWRNEHNQLISIEWVVCQIRFMIGLSNHLLCYKS